MVLGIHTGEDRIGQGRENAKQYLTDHPETMQEITLKVRKAYGIADEESPEEADPTSLPLEDGKNEKAKN